jgi:hypothetical protein
MLRVSPPLIKLLHPSLCAASLLIESERDRRRPRGDCPSAAPHPELPGQSSCMRRVVRNAAWHEQLRPPTLRWAQRHLQVLAHDWCVVHGVVAHQHNNSPHLSNTLHALVVLSHSSVKGWTGCCIMLLITSCSKGYLPGWGQQKHKTLPDGSWKDMQSGVRRWRPHRGTPWQLPCAA